MIGEVKVLKSHPVVSATLSLQSTLSHNRQKLPPGQKANYSSHFNGPKGAYVPPHLRNKPASDQHTGGNNHKKFSSEGTKNYHTQSYKTQKGPFRRQEKPSWKNSSSDESAPRIAPHRQSHFQAWNKKEQAKKEKKEDKVIIKPHCELFLTNLPPQMRTIAGLAAFFHPYGEVAQIQVIGPNDVVPEGVKKWCQNSDLEPSHSAVVEFLTARTAKFVVGVLRKRLAQLNFRVGLIKPGLGEELTYQRNTYGDIVYQPSSGLTQQYIVTKTVITDTSSDSSEVDVRPPLKRVVKRLVTANRIQSDQAYWSQSSSTISSSENSNISSSESDPPSDSDHRSGSPVSETSSTCDKIDEVVEDLSKELTATL
jgi:hypothetical protein